MKKQYYVTMNQRQYTGTQNHCCPAKFSKTNVFYDYTIRLPILPLKLEKSFKLLDSVLYCL